jgi:hypothetical protein
MSHGTATFPLTALQARLEGVYARVRGRGIEAAGGLNLRANRAEIYVLAPAAAAARAAVPVETGVAVVVVDELPREEVVLYGGLPLSSCTSGFTVQNSSGTKGVSTAAHCGNSQAYAGNWLTFQSEYYTGSYDIQWHTLSGATLQPIIKVGSGTRDIYGTVPRASQVTGAWVCKQGKTTGYTCGTTSSTSYCYNGACTWIYVSGGSVNLSEPGDSGGPWFSGTSAYGSHTAGSGNNSVYMPVDYLSGVGVSVVLGTPPPPPPPLSAGIYGADEVPFSTWCYYSGWASGGVPPYTFGWISVGGLDDEWWSGNQYGVLTSWSGMGIEMWMTVRDAAGQYVEVVKYIGKSSYASC